jgi:hypothetical protein
MHAQLCVYLQRSLLSLHTASQAKKAALKTLDVVALLLEKTLFVGLPALLKSGALASKRVQQSAHPEGTAGWELLELIKKDAAEG